MANSLPWHSRGLAVDMQREFLHTVEFRLFSLFLTLLCDSSCSCAPFLESNVRCLRAPQFFVCLSAKLSPRLRANSDTQSESDRTRSNEYRSEMETTSNILVVSCPSSFRKGNTLLQHLRNRATVTLKSISAFNDCRDNLHAFNAIVIQLNQVPENLPTDQACQLTECYRLLAEQCARRRKCFVHLVQNFQASDSEQAWKMSSRLKKTFVFHDLKTTTPEAVAADIRSSNDTHRFSSPGESFAWQLVAGFLCYILPQFQGCVRSTLLDGDEMLRAEILSNFDLTGLDPMRVLVLPKYFLLLNEQVVLNELAVDMTPRELFPGCKKISKGTSDLCLEFDSPGYKKRIPSYLMELENPITCNDSTFTHAVIFCCYAAPMFVMQKLTMSTEDKLLMFQNFRDELQYIINHPKASKMLHEFSDTRDEDFVELKPNTMQVIDAADQSTLQATIVHEIKEHLSMQSWCLVTRSQPEAPAGEDDVPIDDALPLMSMAFAMAANVWLGFSQLLSNHIQLLERTSDDLPYDLPYYFVIPKSGRYPDEAKLRQRIEEIGAASKQCHFQVPSGRRYTYRVHEWNSRRIAFEIPMTVLGIRKQAECSVGGVRPGDLDAHLAEFRDELSRFVSESNSRHFKVVEWDDVTDFVDDAWAEPTCDLARSLFQCLDTSS